MRRLPLDFGHTVSRRSGPHPKLESQQFLNAKRFQTVSNRSVRRIQTLHLSKSSKTGQTICYIDPSYPVLPTFLVGCVVYSAKI